MTVSFTVYGKVEPAGSKKGFVRGGRARIVDANPRAKGYQSRVQDAALEALAGRDLPVYRDEPLAFRMVEYRPRPPSHYNTKGGLNATGRRRPYPTVAPDCGKAARGVEDALAGLVYADDSQLVDVHVRKLYGEPARVEVTITAVDYLDAAHDLAAAAIPAAPLQEGDDS